MTEQTNLVPKTRFNEFRNSYAWETRTLDSIFIKIRNAFVGTATPYYVDSGNFYLQSNNVKNGRINRSTEIFINDKFYKKQKDKWLHTGDLVMVQSGHVGHTAVIEKEYDGIAAHALIMFQGYKDKADPYFLNFQFQTKETKQKLNSITTGNTIKHILASEMKEFEVHLPKIEEQRKIGRFFKHLDDLIILQNRKLEKTKAIKDAYLSEMFPAEGEVVPKRRFTKFDDDWNQCKVSEFGNQISSGGTPKTNYENYWNGNIPWIQSSDLTEDIVAIKESRKKITEEAVNNSATKIIPKNSIAVVTRVGVGKLALIPFEYATSQDFLSISNLNLDKWFATYALYNVLQKEKKSVQGTSIKGMTKDDLLTKEIMIPASHEEQQQIGAYLLKLDNLIALHQNKLNKLQNLKKAYLTEMFI